MYQDAICAAATSPLNSAISIIRVSGNNILESAEKYFSSFKKIEHRKTVFGRIIDREKIIDDVLLTYFKGPESYTGEDVIEISCHGNFLIVQSVLKLLQDMGIRQAMPGEFTKKAFLNGKMDLTEAEAVNQIICARSDWEISTALGQMHGSLKQAVNSIREKVIHIKADVECGIDFLAEDIEFISVENALKQIEGLKQLIEQLYDRCRIGSKISHGVNVAIAGKPNVGKSSILNLLLNTERAIVSEIPGTTRDIVKETIQIAGVHVNLIDTAGIHDAEDSIEKKGIEKSLDAVKNSLIVLAVFDASEKMTDKDVNILNLVSSSNVIYLLNKTDAVNDSFRNEIAAEFVPGKPVVNFSARTGTGLRDLEEAVKSLIYSGFEGFQTGFIADARVLNLLEKSCSLCDSVTEVIKNGEPPEITAFELQQLISTLSEITGDISPDDVLDSVFSRFCIGK
ncbi:MAG: tRNA uridine-5-carboxymethylaminomethyl(34) synthesis GTPase MnmE [Spirochaetes bacterium]|nr:tRNA uridine-5-carboxymethylaminomethyl(34) synthesis GTPase MnmE [Spirochaetota bacterium]